MSDLSRIDYFDGLGTTVERAAFRHQMLLDNMLHEKRDMQHSHAYLVVRGTVRLIFPVLFVYAVIVTVIVIIALILGSVPLAGA
jgi:hypothetical protein